MTGTSLERPEGFAADFNRRPASGLKRSPPAALDRTQERRLVAAARRGDRRALARLLEAVSGTVYRFGKTFCRNPDDAEDVLQDVMAALIRSLGEFRGEAALSTWAFVVARRTCARRRRRAARFDSIESERGRPALQVPDAAASPAGDAERSQLRVALERAIGALPAAQRDVLLLRDVEGRSAAEVAKALGLGERAVKSRLHRARLAVRATLAGWSREGPGPEPPASCPDTARMLSRHLEGELSADVCARLHAHVIGCPSCGQACDELRSVLGACRDWGRSRVPADTQSRVRQAIRGVIGRVAPAGPRRANA